METRKEDLGKCGIYCIINTINGKVYVGKSINIYNRIRRHIRYCELKHRDENRHLIRSWHKYGKEAFEYIVLEYLEPNENFVKDRELYWIIKTNALKRECGYNMRLDTQTNMIVSQETRKLMSRNMIERHIKNPEIAKSIGLKITQFYKDNPEKRKEMSIKVSNAKNKLIKFFQFTREGEFIREWDNLNEILKLNPNYKWQNIYASCNGSKPTYMNCKWRRVPKNEDIVNYILKDISKKRQLLPDSKDKVKV